MANLKQILRVMMTGLFVATAGASLGGCQTWDQFTTSVKTTIDVIGGTKVSGAKAYIALNVFAGIETSTTKFLKLPACAPTSTVICRPRGAAAEIEGPFTTAIAARNQLRAWMKANPDATVADIGLYNALTAATNALAPILSKYGISTGS